MIENLTQKSIISKHERYATGFFSWMRGLMFRSQQNLVMEFPVSRGISLHMWFVFFPIDVLIVDEEMKIVEVKRNFQPWQMWQSSVKGKYVIELGFVDGKYKEGDEISFQ
ncbi:DUF192 domain-containing protein [Candidatus Woesearchaeota archaeon]|nr:DUF192 domain-containing protein [Candidatus Woesearchaeota archaeon]